MQHRTDHLYEFGPFLLDTVERVLLRDGKVVPLTAKVFDTLVVLVQNSGHMLEKNELMQAVWSDSFVEEGSLTRNISTLRKALGESSGGRQYIETVPKRGYRFVTEVKIYKGKGVGILMLDGDESTVIIEKEDAGNHAEALATTRIPASFQTRRLPARSSKIKVVAICLSLMTLVIAAIHLWRSSEAKHPNSHVAVKSVAVLPFKLLSAGDSDEFLGLGMADALITRLGSLNQISIRPTSAISKYSGQEQDLATAGHDLKVDAVIEGSIQRIGGQMRVTARLVRTHDGALIWADTFTGKLADMFAVQDAMSEHLARALALNPVGEDKKLLMKHYTENAEAHQAYTKGRYFWNKRTEEGIRKGIEYFERAIEKDPGYALAHSGLADSYALLASFSMVAPKEVLPRMKEAATEAVELDDQLAEAHTSLAYANMLWDWDWAGAERHFKQAIELNYSYATAHHWYSEYLAAMCRFDEALTEARQAQELDPQSLIINTNVGYILYLAQRNDEAIIEFKKVLEMDPNFSFAHVLLGQTYWEKGMWEEALAQWGVSVKAIANHGAEAQSAASREDIESGLMVFLRKTLESDVERSKRRYVSACHIAGSYILIGEKEMAFKYLQKAYEERDANLLWIKVSSGYDDLRSDQRFTDLLHRIGLEHDPT
jgi:DNA-binding winged helix-turn-helix (wHTH) protein/TolB-like protein/Tfp pilus assembly protein PilF